MGKMQRRKGARGEREIVNKLKENEIPAKRISMMETNGIDKGDIMVADTWKGQVKIGKQVPKFFSDALEGHDMLFTKRDRGDWLITMTVDDWMNTFT